MLPPADQYAERMAGLGLNDEDTIVVYDGSGVNLSAPRVWWTFRVFGHDRVSVLDGGLVKWKAEGRPLEAGQPAPPRPGSFTARLNRRAVRTLADVAANLASRSEQVLDRNFQLFKTVIKPTQCFGKYYRGFDTGLLSARVPLSLSSGWYPVRPIKFGSHDDESVLGS